MYMKNRNPAALSGKHFALKKSGTKQVRFGFTLIEILVVVSILAILTVITVTSINFVFASDVTRSTSRQVQSYLAGARDRAIYAKEPRGVRFLLDANNPNIVSSLVYIAPSPDWDEGVIRLERIDETGGSPSGPDGIPDGIALGDPNPPIVNVRGAATGWKVLYDQGQLVSGARIKIPGDDSGSWYAIDLPNSFGGSPPTDGTQIANDNNYPNILRLSTSYRDLGTASPSEVVAFSLGSGPSTYLLELPPVVLSGEEPTLFPFGAGIDLTRSHLPASWINSSTGLQTQSSQFDILFSPRGAVIGDEAGAGKIHFVIDTIPNMEFTWAANTNYAEGDRIQIRPTKYGTGTAPDMRFVPYDRTYLCTSGGTSGNSPSIFLYGPPGSPNPDARTEGATFNDGSVTWKVELNTSTVLLSLFTRTGKVQANKLYIDDPGTTYFTTSGLDPFKYAETGATTK